jgi:hypothetical protein
MMFCFPGSRDSNISVRPLGGEQQDGGPDREDRCCHKKLEKVLFHQILDFLSSLSEGPLMAFLPAVTGYFLLKNYLTAFMNYLSQYGTYE